jgi:hypothetical protein
MGEKDVLWSSTESDELTDIENGTTTITTTTQNLLEVTRGVPAAETDTKWSPPMLPPSPQPAATVTTTTAADDDNDDDGDDDTSTANTVVADSPDDADAATTIGKKAPRESSRRSIETTPTEQETSGVERLDRSTRWDGMDDLVCRRAERATRVQAERFRWPEEKEKEKEMEGNTRKKRRKCSGARRIAISAVLGGFVESVDTERRQRQEDVVGLLEEAKECKRKADKLAQQKGKEGEALNARLRTALTYVEAIAGLEAWNGTEMPAPPTRVTVLCQGCAELFRFYAAQYRSTNPVHSAFL